MSRPRRWEPPEALVVRLESLPSGDYVSLDVYHLDGRDRDGFPVIEDGVFASDGTQGDYTIENIRRLCSLLQHSPEMFRMLETVAAGGGAHLSGPAQHLINQIRRGEIGRAE